MQVGFRSKFVQLSEKASGTLVLLCCSRRILAVRVNRLSCALGDLDTFGFFFGYLFLSHSEDSGMRALLSKNTTPHVTNVNPQPETPLW